MRTARADVGNSAARFVPVVARIRPARRRGDNLRPAVGLWQRPPAGRDCRWRKRLRLRDGNYTTTPASANRRGRDWPTILVDLLRGDLTFGAVT